jgi:hypothetical protein
MAFSCLSADVHHLLYAPIPAISCRSPTNRNATQLQVEEEVTKLM